jgi:hypothetical protein
MNGGGGDDTFRMLALNAGHVARLNGGNGNDTFTNSGTILSPLMGTVHVNAEGGADNRIVLNDSSDFTGKTAHIDQSSISAFAGDNLFGSGSMYFGNVQRIDLTCGSGSDAIFAQPNAVATLNINLGAQSLNRGTGDTLNLALASAQNYVITPGGAGAGTVTSDNLQPLNYAGVESGPVVDDVAPEVLASSFDFDGVPQQAITLTFSEDVSATLVSGSIALTNITTNQPISAGDIALVYDGGTNVATLTFPNFPFGALPDGDYEMTLPAGAVADAFGNASVTPHDLSFFFLNGDANHDRTVNLTDFNLLAGNFGQSGQTFANGDFTYDGIIDLADFNVLAAQFGSTIGSAGFSRTPIRFDLDRARARLIDSALTGAA